MRLKLTVLEHYPEKRAVRGVFFLVFCISVLIGQEKAGANGLTTPGIRNFTREAYKAASQNWSVCQDGKGIVYVANSIGLLEFDGATWTLYPSPNGNIIRAVAADKAGRIYTSGYMELGYWIRNTFGKLVYTSLSGKAGRFFTPNVEYWNISVMDEKVIFQAFTQMLIYEKDSIRPVNFDSFVNSLSIVRGKMLIHVLDDGIYELDGTAKKPFPAGVPFHDKLVRFILPSGDDNYLIGTDSDGIFKLGQGVLTPWNTPLNDIFKKARINRGCLNSSGNLLVGTILDGLFLLDTLGNLIWKADTENGLQNNTVLGIYPDNAGNTWLALDHGIDLVSPAVNESVSFNPVAKIGAVYSAAILSDTIYLGTNQGLYIGINNRGRDNFRLIPGTQGQIWDLKVIRGRVIAGHNTGTFLISGGKATYISRISGAFSLIPDPAEENSYLQCTYSNLVKFKNAEEGIRQTQVIYNFNELIRYMEIDHQGNIWAGHMHRGLYMLRFNVRRDSVKILRYFGPESGLEGGNKIHVFKISDRVVFTTGVRLFTYDDLRDTILPYEILNLRLGDYARATRIIPSGDNHYWFITSQVIGLLRIDHEAVRIIREFPREIFGNLLIHDYENIVPVSPEKALICLENGYAWLNGSGTTPGCTFCDTMPDPGEIVLTGLKGHMEHIPLTPGILKIPYQVNNLTVRWSFPHFQREKYYFSWKLEGLSNDWSGLKESPYASFERLPAGKYSLKGRISDLWGNQSRVYSLPVVVYPPWYWSLTARILYFLLIALLLFLFRRGIIRRIQKKELRKREENEKELMTIKNEKLQSDIMYKSKELASSTMVIIQKNKILTDLKELLQTQKSEHGKRIPFQSYNDIMRKIEETLSNRDDWNIFETNFEQAHEAFVKNLKNRFVDLTPNDMRLCAFLRMNLSSKEIAPLLGISIRGVENHRYRLRQKMKLNKDDNLTETILKL